MKTRKKSQLEIWACNVEKLFNSARIPSFLFFGNSEISENAGKPLFSERDIVYIAGPMTGRPLFNYVQFFGIAGLIEKEYGCRVLNPARQPNGLAYSEYIELALADVRQATAILLLQGWESSPGARKEFCA